VSSLNLFLPITEVFRYALFVLCQNELYAVRNDMFALSVRTKYRNKSCIDRNFNGAYITLFHL